MTQNRILVFAGGLAGAAGVALSAAAAHVGGDNLATAASFLSMHAPALLAIGLLGHGAVSRLGAFVILVGLGLFCGDLLLRHYADAPMFPMAAPAGGTLIILGWLVVAASAFGMRRHLADVAPHEHDRPSA